MTPIYVPPPLDSDAPLDPIEQALVRALAAIILRELRAEAVAAGDTRITTEDEPMPVLRRG